METREQKELRLAELKSSLLTVEGSPTEVYSRIVGYYRSVRNWNAGKREEFGNRVEYSFPSTVGGSDMSGDAFIADRFHGAASGRDQRITSYLLFYRASCPNCPPVKVSLGASGLLGAEVDVDTPEGLDQARRFEVLSTPTAVLLDGEGEEVARARDRADLEVLLGRGAERIAETAKA